MSAQQAALEKIGFIVMQVLLLTIPCICFYHFFLAKKNDESAIEYNTRICMEIKSGINNGVIIRIIPTPYRAPSYMLSDSGVFSPKCIIAPIKIEIGDSIFKPSGTFDFFLYKQANPDSVIFLPCDFDCSFYEKKYGKDKTTK